MTTNMDDKELIAALRKAVEHTAIVGTGTFTDMINLAADRLEALQSASVTVKLHGPYGWLNGHRALNEEYWHLERDPESSEEYFAIPLYALSDPFVEIGLKGPDPATPDQLEVVKGEDVTALVEFFRVAQMDGCTDDPTDDEDASIGWIGDKNMSMTFGHIRRAAAAVEALTTSDPQPVKDDWRCPECRCTTYARCDEQKSDGTFGPGSIVRCVNCKLEQEWPPAPEVASGDQMERFRPGGKYTKHMVPDPNGEWVTLDAAQNAITAANERAERLDQAARAGLRAQVASEALVTTLSEALEPFALISTEGVVKQRGGHARVVVAADYFHKAAEALAALPAKQGEHSDEA
jgi:hypothetical protein